MNEIETTTIGTHFGTYEIDSSNGDIIEVRGQRLDPDPSAIGQAFHARKSLRVQRPAVRLSWLTNGPGSNNNLRGSDPFVEVSWEKVFELVAVELERVRDKHGNNSIFAGSYGWGSSGRVHAPLALLSRFLRMFGGYTDTKGTYSSSAAETVVPYFLGMGYHEAIGKGTSWSIIADNTDLFVSFGGLRLSNTEVTYGGQGTHHTRDWMRSAIDKGTEFLNIGPLKDDVDEEFKSRWQPIRPGTDVALMASLVHTLIIEKRTDEQFLQTYCHGWEIFKEYILGGSDGVAKDAAWGSAITTIPEDEIKSLAREMSEKRTLINLTLSVQRADHGEQSYWMGMALACALGQVGLPGGGLAFPFGTQGNVGSGQVRKRVAGMPLPPKPENGAVISVSRVSELLEGAGNTHRWNGTEIALPDIHLVWWAGGNPFHHHQDLNRLQRAWEKPDTIIIQEPFWTATARRADIVLPSSLSLERNDIGGAETQLIAHQKMDDPPGEALDDYEIFAQLAEILQFGDRYSEGRNGDEWVETVYEIFRADNTWAPDYAEFRKMGYLQYPDMPAMGEKEQVFLSEFRREPSLNPLRTPSGKIEIFSEQVAAFEYLECPGHPTWIEPFERVGGVGSEKHPLHLISNQPQSRLHSQFDHAEPSQATKVSGREPARLHPSTAADRNIKNGDVVRIFNDRGACLAGAVLDSALMPEVVQLSTGAWYDPDEDGTCRAGNPNVLTRDKGTSELAQGPSAHTCLVDVELLVGDAPNVKVYEMPKFTEMPKELT